MAALRRLGLLGGMSWESTAIYYRGLNQGVRDRVGGGHSAPLLLWSCDFAEIIALQTAGRWDEAGAILADAARSLKAGGAEAIMICCNTMHEVADAITASTSVPLLHIADAAGGVLATRGVKRPLLLGTRYTMEMSFVSGRLSERYGLEVVIPAPQDRADLQRVIYDELCVGVVSAQSRAWLIDLIERQRLQGADSVILGCTELGLLVKQADLPILVCDTAEAHVAMALDFILADAVKDGAARAA